MWIVTCGIKGNEIFLSVHTHCDWQGKKDLEAVWKGCPRWLGSSRLLSQFHCFARLFCRKSLFSGIMQLSNDSRFFQKMLNISMYLTLHSLHPWLEIKVPKVIPGSWPILQDQLNLLRHTGDSTRLLLLDLHILAEAGKSILALTRLLSKL